MSEIDLKTAFVPLSAASDDEAQRHVSARLLLIRNEKRLPLLCVDMDDTFLPFGKVITPYELDAIKAYLEAGGHLAFNTLAPKEWFYLRVVEPLVFAFHQNDCTHLLSRLHWIVSGGREIFVYECANRSYRRIHDFSARTKAEGLLPLLTHLGPTVAVLAFYGDRFDDPQNDGNAIGKDHIPLVVNVGADQVVACAPGQTFINAAGKGPATTLNHLRLITAELQKGAQDVIADSLVAQDESRQDSRGWRFEFATDGRRTPGTPTSVEVSGPGFLWSWNETGLSYLTPLIPKSYGGQLRGKISYTASLPEGGTQFTFFWTGGQDVFSGESPGHWEGQDFTLRLTGPTE